MRGERGALRAGPENSEKQRQTLSQRSANAVLMLQSTRYADPMLAQCSIE